MEIVILEEKNGENLRNKRNFVENKNGILKRDLKYRKFPSL
jgi:hypothetical protein